MIKGVLYLLNGLRRRSGRSGQAMVEYAVVAGMLAAAGAILLLFLAVFREYSVRVLDLAASDYP